MGYGKESFKKPLLQEDRKLFMTAMEQFNVSGRCTVKCDVCQSTIMFERRGSAIIHSCECGKFRGSLKGL